MFNSVILFLNTLVQNIQLWFLNDNKETIVSINLLHGKVSSILDQLISYISHNCYMNEM